MISRKEFMRKLGLAFISPLTAIRKKESKEIYLGDFYVAGFQYYEGVRNINKISVNSVLRVKPEFSNEYDEDAIALYYDDFKIGYMPADLNFIPARLVEQNIKLKAVISDVNPSAPTWEMVQVGLYQVIEEGT
jgi:hypothetical protein